MRSVGLVLPALRAMPRHMIKRNATRPPTAILMMRDMEADFLAEVGRFSWEI